MSHPPSLSRAIARAAAAGVLVLCVGVQSAAAQSTPKIDVPTKPLPQGYFGKLKHALDTYTSADIMGEVGGKGWYGWERPRLCIDPTNTHCQGGALDGRMMIQAIGDAHKVPANGSGKFGVVIGRMKNTGDFTDAATGIEGRLTVRYPSEYLFVVKRKNAQKSEVVIAEVAFDQTTGLALDKPVTVVTPKYASYSPCADGNPNHGHEISRDYARGDFRTCDMDAPPDQVPTAGEPELPKMRMGTRFAESIAWFACSDGCCTVTWPPSARLNLLERAKARRVGARQHGDN